MRTARIGWIIAGAVLSLLSLALLLGAGVIVAAGSALLLWLGLRRPGRSNPRVDEAAGGAAGGVRLGKSTENIRPDTSRLLWLVKCLLLNRWTYRVAAYVLLLRDEYPPFRLDAGGPDPGSWMRLTGEPSSTPPTRPTVPAS
jgi:hypothetical protein